MMQMLRKTKWMFGCLSLCALAGVLASYVSLFGHTEHYEFELRICGQIPDLNRYAIISAKTINVSYPGPHGYALYYGAMRENGISPLILVDELLDNAQALFAGTRIPTLEFPGHSSAIDIIRRTQSYLDAVKAIETNAVSKCRIDVLELISECSGIGVYSGIDCFCRGRISEDLAIIEAKEALAACAFRVAFPKVNVPRIEEDWPMEERRLVLHGRVPIPVRATLVAQRRFDFYDADDRLFARLQIKPAYNCLYGWPVEGSNEIYRAIFRYVFSELNSAVNETIIRGRAYYDSIKGLGIVYDIDNGGKSKNR